MIYNKKGGTAFIFIYGLAFLMAIGILYIMFNQVTQVHLKPVVENQIPDDSIHKQDIIDKNEVWLSYWEAVPILFVLSIMLYWFVNGAIAGEGK